MVQHIKCYFPKPKEKLQVLGDLEDDMPGGLDAERKLFEVFMSRAV